MSQNTGLRMLVPPPSQDGYTECYFWYCLGERLKLLCRDSPESGPLGLGFQQQDWRPPTLHHGKEPDAFCPCPDSVGAGMEVLRPGGPGSVCQGRVLVSSPRQGKARSCEDDAANADPRRAGNSILPSGRATGSSGSCRVQVPHGEK